MFQSSFGLVLREKYKLDSRGNGLMMSYIGILVVAGMYGMVDVPGMVQVLLFAWHNPIPTMLMTECVVMFPYPLICAVGSLLRGSTACQPWPCKSELCRITDSLLVMYSCHLFNEVSMLCAMSQLKVC